ncbi:glycosyltransferase [Sphingobacterium zeae]|uniref:glycosyltransferase n=1 Tax=Sphingobacterium zeae TaxID=1776859 RepID=UPI003622A2C4
MKILQLGKFYPIRGGVEKVMYDLMLGLSEGGVCCDMLCASTEDHPAAEIQVNPYARLFVVPTSVKIAGTMLAPAMVTKLRKIAGQYDIIHIHHPDPMASLALYLSGYRGRVVLHWHSDILKQKHLLKLYRPLQSWLINRAEQIVGTTPVYVEQSPFLQHVAAKIDFIPIGVSPMAYDEAAVADLRGRYPGKTIIFSLGRLVEYKGYAYLIQAMQQLNDAYHLIIGGKGPLEPELNQLIADLNLQDCISMAGFVADEDIPTYFGAADIFCLSSIWKTEAFAIVQIEAMSCGKPIVSTAIPGSGVSWVNQDQVSGLVVAPENAAALAAAIQQIGSDPACYQRCSEGGRKRYEANFTREKMIAKCRRVYEKY